MGLNQIYKVVWSKTKGCYVVVSELAKRVGRNKTKAVVVATAAMAMVVAPVMVGTNTVDASIAIGSTTDNTFEKGTANAKDGGSIAIGSDVDASVGDRVIAIGNSTKSQGGRNTVIGAFATAGYDGSDKLTGGNKRSVGQSIAIGAGSNYKEGARAYGDQAIAIGSNTIAYGNSSIAIGNDDVDRAVTVQTTYTNSDGNKVTGTIGDAYTNLTGKNLKTDGGRWKDAYAGEAAVTIGVKSEANDISVALGTGAKAKAVNALALGTGATATLDNSVALGGGSVTDKEGTKQTSVTVNGFTYNWSGGSTTGKGDVVSFGKAGYERQLKNVAAGEVSATSTDGINGSQLYGILNNMTIDPTFLYAGDNADAGEVTGADADAKKADADKKKIVSRSMKDSRLNLLGGADKTKLSEGNIGVNYENGNTLTFKLAKDLKGLDSTNVGGIVTNAAGINMNNKPITNVAGNLPGAKEGTDEPTTASEGPEAADLPSIKKNAATVGDVLNAGWNLQNNGAAKDIVKPYDTVNFINGEGTTAVVETTDNKVSTVKFDVKLGAGLKKDDKGNISVDAGDITNENGAPKVEDADKGKVATVDTVVNAINNSYWTASATKGDDKIGTDDNIKSGNTVTFDAGKNIEIDHSTANKFTFKTVDNPEFKTLDLNDGAGNKVNLAPTADGLKVGKGDNNEPANITNVTSGLKPYAETAPDSPDAKKGLVDLSKPKDGSDPKVSDNTAATVGDLRNMGWVVSADKTTDGEGEYSEAVKNANEVKFVGKGSATVSGKTDENGVRTITVDVNDQAVANNAASPVVYTDENGDRVYPTGKKDEKGNLIFSKNPDGSGAPVTGPIKTSINGPEGTKTPTTLDNVAGNLPGAKKDTEAPTTTGVGPTEEDAKKIANNAATVGDVLNAGWNLQGNGKDVDFVKPYDTVNFIDGEGTTAVVETKDNKVSTVKYDVKLGAGLKKDKDGNITVDAGDITNENGKPKVADADKDKVATAGNVANAINNSYWIASAEKDGKTIGANDNVKPSTKVTFDAGKNIEIDHSTPNKFTFKTVDNPEFKTLDLNDGAGNKVNLAPTADGLKVGKGDNNEPANITNVTSGLKPYAETAPDSPDAKKGLVDLSKPKDGSDPKVSDNTAATVGDLRNMGWVVSADKTTDGEGEYSEAVKNANEVKFVGKGSATVSGKTDENGVRTITVDVNDQAVANNAASPVVYTDENGDRVYPTGKKDEKGNLIFSKNPDGSGAPVTGPIKTSINGPEGTKTPTTLDNVAGNLPGAKKDTEAPTTTGVGPTEEDAKKIANNAATVGDVLNAGWNLQGNGKDVDFVKPYDTVNFIDGEGTTAVVKTTDNKVSTVTYNVNLGAGLEKGDDNKIKVKTDGDTITVGEDGGLKVNAGSITVNDTDGKDADGNVVKAGTVSVPKADQNKVATVGDVANAINNAAWKATSGKDGSGVVTGTTTPLVKAGNTVTYRAGNNLILDQADKTFTYSLNPTLTGLTSAEFTDKDGNVNKIDVNGITITSADKTKQPVSLTNNGLDNGNNRITNVAQGVGDTDAVNVSQLKGVANAVAEVGNRVNRSGAQAAALAGLQTIQYDPLEPTQISAGVGHYKGSSALALGVNHYKNESTLFHVGASFNGRSSETMANASVTWKFGSRADETAVKDTFRQGPISASYTLQDKVSALEVQNSAQKDEIAELRALAATQQAQIAELFKRLNEKA